MYQFEKILKDNDIAEDDTGLSQSITNQIKKFRKVQQLIRANPDEVDENEKREAELLVIDTKIMQTLPEQFEIEDEEEELSKKELEKQALAEKNRLAEQKANEEKEIISALKARAQAVNLPDDSTEADIIEAEAKAKIEADELAKPATTDSGALEKLFKRGKKTVTISELKSAGFDTGFMGPIGMHGVTCGNYKIYRSNPGSSTFELFKL